MTYEQMEQLVEQGTWRKEILAQQSAGSFGPVGSGTELTKNINKFKYFAIEVAHNIMEITSNPSGQTAVVTVVPCGWYLFDRDYVNKWIIEHECSEGGTYLMQGNYGTDGSKVFIDSVTIPEDAHFSNFYIRSIVGYRPTRKIIYAYKTDSNTYLLTSDDKYLYTIDDLKIAAADIAR